MAELDSGGPLGASLIGGFVLIWFHLLPFFSASLILLLMVLVSFQILLGLVKNSGKAWLPYFCRSGQRETSIDEFNEEVDGWLPLGCLKFHLPQRLIGQVLADVVQRKGATAGSLGWAGLEGVEGLACLLV